MPKKSHSLPGATLFTVGDYYSHPCAGLLCFCKDSPGCHKEHVPVKTSEGLRCRRCFLVLDSPNRATVGTTH